MHDVGRDFGMKLANISPENRLNPNDFIRHASDYIRTELLEVEPTCGIDEGCEVISSHAYLLETDQLWNQMFDYIESRRTAPRQGAAPELSY